MRVGRRRVLQSALGAGALALGLGAQWWWRTAAPENIAAQILASSFQDFSGRPQTLAAYRGQVLILNYWATWCPPCREELPLLNKVQQDYAANGVQVVGIAIDRIDNIRQFTKTMALNYPQLIGGIDTVEQSRLAGNQAGALPFTLFFNRQGQIAHRVQGAVTAANLNAEIVRLL